MKQLSPSALMCIACFEQFFQKNSSVVKMIHIFQYLVVVICTYK